MKFLKYLAITIVVAVLASAQPKQLTDAEKIEAAKKAIAVLQAQAKVLMSELQRIENAERAQAANKAYDEMLAKLLGPDSKCQLTPELELFCPEAAK